MEKEREISWSNLCEGRKTVFIMMLLMGRLFSPEQVLKKTAV